MRTLSTALLALAAVSALVGCDDLATFQAGGPEGCSAGFRTCEEADCYGTCLCEGESASTCERECGGTPSAVLADLDDAAWDPASEAMEDEVVALTNEARAEGGCCGSRCFDPTPPLDLDADLRRAARRHALDMFERDYFDHVSPDDRTPFDRIRESGFDGCAMGENIAEGQLTAGEVVSGWLRSPEHCANIRESLFDAIGVGYHEASNRPAPTLWVQTFGG